VLEVEIDVPKTDVGTCLACCCWGPPGWEDGGAVDGLVNENGKASMGGSFESLVIGGTIGP
jgi:hypothetical protein